MYVSDLDVMTVGIDRLFLDPNNPRFWSETTKKDTPDKKITEGKTQDACYNNIIKFGVEELYLSILRNGFLPLDRIVVREISGQPGHYVVLEGNRRLAALKMLRERIDNSAVDEEGITEEYLDTLMAATNEIEVLVYKGSITEDIAWLLQGIRHISGIREWKPAQRARLVADQIEKEGMKFKEAGQRFGLSAREVGRLYRSYKALQQMREDEEYQAKAKNEWFSLFEEAIRNRTVSTWLEWDDSDYKFHNTTNLKMFYSWISEDEDHGNDRRIHDPSHIKALAFLIEGHESMLTRVDQYELDIVTAKGLADGSPSTFDWKGALKRAAELVSDIPQGAIATCPEEFLELIDALAKRVGLARRMGQVAIEAVE